MRITCFGSGNKTGLYPEVEKLGELLQENGYQATVVTGGSGGTGMEAAPKGAFNKNHKSERIGFLYKEPPDGNQYLTQTFNCRAVAHAICSNYKVEEFNETLLAYCVRLAGLLSSDAFVVAIDGGIGTLLEFVAILTAVERGFIKKPIAVLGSKSKLPEFTSLISTAQQQGITIFQGNTATEVASWLKKQLSSLGAMPGGAYVELGSSGPLNP